MAQDSDWLSFGLSSGTRCGERPRGLFLQLLLGSMLLVAGSAPVQASGVVYKCMRAFVYVSGPPVGVSGAQAPGFAPASGMYGVIPAKSNIKHQTTTVNTGIHSPAPCHNPRSESPQSINHSFIHSFTHSNGALLAHQTTSLSVPLPAARNGAAASAPLPEAGGRGNKMNHHFQICTKGYLAGPGIPVPASGLWIVHPGADCGQVDRWTGGQDALSMAPLSTWAETLGFIWKYRNTSPAPAMGQAPAYSHVFPRISLFQFRYLPPCYNTAIPQHRNTIMPQYHNAIPPLHPPPKTSVS